MDKNINVQRSKKQYILLIILYRIKNKNDFLVEMPGKIVYYTHSSLGE